MPRQQKIKNQKSKIENPPLPTPASLGYSMPAEWEPQDATWIAWPHGLEDWPEKTEVIPWVYAELVRHLAYGQRVHIFVQPSKQRHFAREVTSILRQANVNLAHVTLHTQPTDRVWTRDSGPIFLKKNKIACDHQSRDRQGATVRQYENGASRSLTVAALNAKLAVADFKFNAWAKYDNSSLDDQLPTVIADQLRLPHFVVFGENDAGEYQRFVLEGGSIDVNGKGPGGGCLLTTEECLLSKIQQRNPGFSRDRIEQTLRDYLGVTKILWLNRGIAGDIDTHGHVDDTARFVNPTTIVACAEPNRSDANHAPLRENLKRLKQMRDTRGKPFTIAEIPMPEPVHFNKQRLPASYANFTIANVGVLVPVFNDPADMIALKIFEQLFTDRPIIPIYSRDLVLGLGALHCITQQQPSV
ncbi:MAG: agmatine deiminase family protein [Phycisphaerales bacterium]|nr:agmatine deiminase family protein [Phycisphaerales bacterium]